MMMMMMMMMMTPEGRNVLQSKLQLCLFVQKENRLPNFNINNCQRLTILMIVLYAFSHSLKLHEAGLSFSYDIFFNCNWVDTQWQ